MAGLAGKIAIVTGSSRGIGRAIAERLARDGAQVVVNYARSADGAREVVSAIERAGGRATALQADVSRLEEVRRLFDEAQRQGGLEIVVANAGAITVRPFVETRDEDYEQSSRSTRAARFTSCARRPDGCAMAAASSRSRRLPRCCRRLGYRSTSHQRWRPSTSRGCFPRNWAGAVSPQTSSRPG